MRAIRLLINNLHVCTAIRPAMSEHHTFLRVETQRNKMLGTQNHPFYENQNKTEVCEQSSVSPKCGTEITDVMGCEGEK